MYHLVLLEIVQWVQDFWRWINKQIENWKPTLKFRHIFLKSLPTTFNAADLQIMVLFF